ncbi:MAG: hypothetical protein KGI39_03495 [Patescibacteria group bacterium]|nr:hypothetical protein [Patescibacteria group bacterium]
MENNNKKTTAIVIAIIVIILIGAGFYFSSKKSGVQTATEGQIPLKNGSSSNYEITTINARHQYKNGKHTYVGMIDLPTPCHSVSVTAVPSDATNHYTLQFTTKTTDGVCAQVITPRPFRVEFAAPKNITVGATLDGKPVNLNILEVKEGDNIDKVQFNDKG